MPLSTSLNPSTPYTVSGFKCISSFFGSHEVPVFNALTVQAVMLPLAVVLLMVVIAADAVFDFNVIDFPFTKGLSVVGLWLVVVDALLLLEFV